ncbi:MAG: YdjC family protein [Armatimonadetes bacterium]|nr:YdjC family protein [Armatimonadota bacterium]
MPCRLIINADDFGWSSGTNEAIADLYDAGVLTSTSLMVGGAAAAEAVELARARPGLAVGLHLALTVAPALLTRQEVPLLVDADGWLPRDWLAASIRYSLLPTWRRQMRREAAAQFAEFSRLGLPWSHVDTHLHLGLTPVVFHVVLELAARYGVRALRIPEDDFELAREGDSTSSRRQRLEARVLAGLCRRQRARLAESSHLVTRRCYGYFRSGQLSEGYLCRLAERMPDGDFELHCHPDSATDSGVAEWKALRSPAFRQAIERRGIELITYFSLG